MSSRTTHHSVIRHAHAGVVLLVLALLWAQLLGLAHSVRHARLSVAVDATAFVAQSSDATGLLAHLLAPAGDDGDCRLYDQLGQGGPLTQLPLFAPVLLPVLPVWAVHPSAPARACAAFAARAPPLSR